MKEDSRLEIFKSVKKLIKVYEPPLVATSDFEGRYELVSKKEVTIAARKRDEVYFAGLIIQSSYVGFYFMPVYVDVELKAELHPDLIKMLKGKSCFHLKNLDDRMLKEIKNALKLGFELYKENEWV